MFKCCVCGQKKEKIERKGDKNARSPGKEAEATTPDADSPDSPKSREKIDSASPKEQKGRDKQDVEEDKGTDKVGDKDKSSENDSARDKGTDKTPDKSTDKDKDTVVSDDKNKPNGEVQMRQDNSSLNNIEEIKIDSSTKVEETNNSFGQVLEADEILKNPISNGPLATLKSNIYDGPAYIERTIYDGPDDEGDDSVFETCPTDEELSKKTPPVSAIPRWLSEEEDGDVGGDNASEICGGMQEPPATPVARDELALRRHRFFSDLLYATQNSNEHRVRFDPLGPMVHVGCEGTDREEHLEELVNRLENVTKRLEKVPTSNPPAIETQEIAVQTSTPSPKKKPDHLPSTEVEQKPVSFSNSPENTAKNMSVAGYEDLLAGPVNEFLQLSEKIGGDVATQSKLVEKAFQIQLQFLQTAASRPAPTSQSEQMSLLGPTSAQIQQIQEFREKNRGSVFFNHLSAISESIPALGWVAVSPTPGPYVKEMNDAGQFYTNRVLKDWKEKDKTHVEWCKAWVQTLSDLQKYVRQHHTTGLVWAKTGSVPPPPPPCGVPPPPPSMPVADMPPTSVNDDRSALFAQINQGEGITKNLKKVTSDMQTHKNPSLRTGPAPFKAPASNSVPMKSVPPANAPIDKPPVFTRDGKKWLVEYHKGNKDLLVDNVEMNNVIYMFRCQESTLVVKGKVNSIVMDSCRKSSVVFDSVVSSIEFVNCQSVQMQVLGKVPTISIDKTDGCQMYLSPESLDVELITSKSSEMNVMVPKGNGDYTEYPVPEQFKTTISPKGLNTIAVDSLG